MNALTTTLVVIVLLVIYYIVIIFSNWLKKRHPTFFSKVGSDFSTTGKQENLSKDQKIRKGVNSVLLSVGIIAILVILLFVWFIISLSIGIHSGGQMGM
jgi:Ca2+/Na+ antiporter